MKTTQKAIKYLAIAFAIFLAVSIVGGIFSIIGLVFGLFSNDGVETLENTKTYSVSSDIRDLDIEIRAADFYIKEGEVFSVESNLKKLSVEEKNGCLTVKDKTRTKISSSYDGGAVLTVYIPKDIELESVEISTGAGKVTVDSLCARVIDFELGAGDVSIEKISVTRRADIEGGAGRISVSSGDINNLDMDMGLGEVNLSARLSGESSFDMGVGEANITLLGSKDDYDIEVEKGIGNITVDGKSVTDFGSGGSGEAYVRISGGIGNLNLNFEENLAQ